MHIHFQFPYKHYEVNNKLYQFENDVLTNGAGKGHIKQI